MARSAPGAHPFLIAAIVAAAVLLPFAAGQTPSLPPASPAPAPDCLTALFGLADCQTYVQNGSTLTKPDQGCCGGLKTLVDTQPICLCTLIQNPDALGIPIDFGKALGLPAICNQAVPDISNCGASDTPPVAHPPSEEAGPAPPPTEGEGPATPPTEEITPSPSPVSPRVAPAPAPVRPGVPPAPVRPGVPPAPIRPGVPPAPVRPGVPPAPVRPGVPPAPVEVPSNDQSLSSALRMTLTHCLLMGVAAILFSYLLY